MSSFLPKGTPSSNGESGTDQDDFVSILPLVNETAASLTHQNPFLPSSDFNLFDSMSALEIGDPKMDSCEIPIEYYSSESFRTSNGKPNDVSATVPPRQAPSQLEDSVSPLPWDDLNIETTRILLLEMMNRFESLLDGSSVAESLFTCFYAHDGILRDMTQRLLRDGGDPTMSSGVVGSQWAVYSSALTLVKTSILIRNIVTHADIYEEEDFTINKYSFGFFEDFQTLCESKREKSDEFEDVLEVLDKGIDFIIALDVEEEAEESRTVVHQVLEFQRNFFKNCISLVSISFFRMQYVYYF